MNITKILECCPKGTELYSPVYGKVTLEEIISTGLYPIKVITDDGYIRFYTKEGKLFYNRPDGECVLFPSKNQRDWNKFNINTKVNNKDSECQLKQPENCLPSYDIGQNYKRIPFNIKLAKKIVNDKVEGKIVTMEGRKVRIVCWDKEPISDTTYKHPIVVLATSDFGGERLYTCTEKGEENNPRYKGRYDLIIEIPNYYYKNYYNFEPQKYQPCLVRNGEDCLWGIQVYSHTDYQGKKLFCDNGGHLKQFTDVLPLLNDTKHLIGTTKSFEQLIQEFKEKDI